MVRVALELMHRLAERLFTVRGARLVRPWPRPAGVA
jgi:hypothetical protein